MNFSLNIDGNLQQGAKLAAGALEKFEKTLGSGSKALDNFEKKAATGVKALGEMGSESGNLTARSVALANVVGGLLSNAFTFLANKAREAFGEIAKFSEARADFERGLESIYGSEEAAKHTYDVISTITDRVAVSQENALKIFDRLEKAGMQNGNMAVKATETIAKAEAARKGAGDALQGVLERASKSRYFSISRDELRAAGLTFGDLAKSISGTTGKGIKDAELALRAGRVSLSAGVDALTSAVDKKLGKVADKKFLTIGVQAQRLRDNIGRLFSSLDTSKFAAGLQRLANLFGENTVAGSAMRTLLEKAFSAIGDVIEKVAPYAEVFFLGLELAALKVYNALYPVRRAIAQAFGGDNSESIKSFEDLMLSAADAVGKFTEFVVENATPIAVALGAVLAPAIWSVASGLGAAALSAAAAAAPFVALGAAIFGLYKAGQWAIKAVQEIWEYFDGSAIVDGLIKGITDGAGRLIGAMKNMAKGALDAFKNAFGIKSPSRVMMQQGRYINQGLEKGLDESSAGPEKAMAEPPSPPARLSGASYQTTNNTGSAVTFAPGSVVLNVTGGASQDHDEIKATVTQVFIDLFEQIGVTMGAPR